MLGICVYIEYELCANADFFFFGSNDFSWKRKKGRETERDLPSTDVHLKGYNRWVWTEPSPGAQKAAGVSHMGTNVLGPSPACLTEYTRAESGAQITICSGMQMSPVTLIRDTMNGHPYFSFSKVGCKTLG